MSVCKNKFFEHFAIHSFMASLLLPLGPLAFSSSRLPSTHLNEASTFVALTNFLSDSSILNECFNDTKNRSLLTGNNKTCILLQNVNRSLYPSFSDEIEANFTLKQVKQLRRALALGDESHIAYLKNLSSITYLHKSIIGLPTEVLSLVNELLKQNDYSGTERIIETELRQHLIAERERILKESKNPGLKQARFTTWESHEQLTRERNALSNDLLLPIDTVFNLIQSEYFIPELVKTAAELLQTLKNTHLNERIGYDRKRAIYQNVNQNADSLYPLLYGYGTSKKLNRKKYNDNAEPTRPSAFQVEVNKLKNPDQNDYQNNLSVDIEIVQLLRETLTGTLKFPPLSIQDKIGSLLRKETDSKFSHFEWELDYFRRSMGIYYVENIPGDYRPDFFSNSEMNDSVIGNFVKIPSGTFMMGSPETEANRMELENQHKVTLSGFEILDNAVTQGTYAALMGNNPSYFRRKINCPESFRKISIQGRRVSICEDFPVERVSWEDAKAFTDTLNLVFENSEYYYRLPTEAEFEYVIRGGSTSTYVSGDDSALLGFYLEASFDRTYSVLKQSKKANDFKVYRSGVWEWAQDWFGPYSNRDQVDPKGPLTGKDRVLRGGSYLVDSKDHRSARRAFNNPKYSGRDIGFRVVRVIKNP